MSLTFCTLASGSKGNCTYVAAGESAVLIDCGLSAKQTLMRLEARGLPANRIKAILITHEHGDHIRGIRVLAKRLGATAVATPATWGATRDRASVRHQAMTAGSPFSLNGMQIHPFSVSHDAVDPVGLVISAGEARLGVATDLGKATTLVSQRLAGCGGLILEHNHDTDMLMGGAYPPWLKQRVRSSQGHLSNQEGAELLARLCHQGLKQVLLAHISQKNNRPELAEAAAREALAPGGHAPGLAAADQDEPSQVFFI
ncbi:MAG: MBL fold metallo-hydrolase [Desulfarculaceae bacterium]|nr:MBL fold metallo-hydrolase [Desulfarculaceae bacterium]MCF8071054.1 MBL fold metallo-hydrolase [Desulfarculaceae bacterium]MCF8100642.1 MBL fold metallo-hydrolase [Desulfarculaceae bacterium]MCF8116924.1 MBL fold metallo-hydrolase [Desulfarculaceae bacterium]